MARQISAQKRPRIPQEHNGIQVNACKNPQCKNFGVPATQDRSDPNYRISGSTKAARTNGNGSTTSLRVIICRSCNESIPVKSNLAIQETIDALKWSPDNHFCPNTECSNNASKIPVGTPAAYVKRGKTETGNQRWKCKECGKAFVISRTKYPSTHGSKSHKYTDNILHVVNATPIKRQMEVLDLNAPVIYNNIERAYKACLRFNLEREKRLRHLTNELFLCTDRQAYGLNWDNRRDKRLITYRAVGTADCESGYVFPLHLSYDPHADQQKIHQESFERGDHELAMSFRRYSQYWLNSDYPYLEGKSPPANIFPSDTLERINARYGDSSSRDDVELPSDTLSSEVMLPKRGMQLREDYVLYAHFLILKNLLVNTEKVHFFTEQESGIRAAYMSGFGELVGQNRSDLFYVSVKDGATRDERENAAKQRARIIKDLRAEYGDIPIQQIKEILLRVVMENHLVEFGHWKDQWALYPLPSKGEVEKAFSHMTHREGDDLAEKCRIASHCTMLPIDNFFQVVRRRITALERPLSSPASSGRRWYGKSPYNPYMPVQYLEILRTYFNYCSMGDKKRVTPAQKIGLAEGQVELRKILRHYE